MTLTEKIHQLSDLWRMCVVGYHKDRDCHHYLVEKYSYGDLSYEVNHYGYINNTTEKTFKTKEAAQLFLMELLTEQIKDRCNFSLKEINSGDYDEFEHSTPEHWNNILNKLSELNDKEVSDAPNSYNTNELERLLQIEYRYNQLKTEMNYAHEQLDKLNVLRHDYKYPVDLSFSLGYRIELLERMNKNAKNNN